MDNSVYAVAAMPDGGLIAGGRFAMAGGVAANCIARWDGRAWNPLGTGITSGTVLSMASLPNGDLIVGGGFITAGGLTAHGVARWNGSSWSSLGAGPGFYYVFA